MQSCHNSMKSSALLISSDFYELGKYLRTVSKSVKCYYIHINNKCMSACHGMIFNVREEDEGNLEKECIH